MKSDRKIIIYFILMLSSQNIFCQDSTFVKYVDHVGISAGIWFPEKANNIGTQSLLGISASLKKKIHSLNVYADIIGFRSKTHGTVTVLNNNLPVDVQNIWGQQYSISYGIDVVRISKFTTSLEAGIGHSVIMLNPKAERLQQKYNHIVPGVNFRVDLTKTTVVRLLLQYYLCGYAPVNKYPEITGNYFSARIIFGFR
jgi:hypothetical protein